MLPHAVAVENLNNIPEQLKKCSFVLHKGKVPKQILGFNASSTNKETWSTFEEAKKVFIEKPNQFDGLSIALDTSYICIDLDNAITAENQIKGWANDILGRFSSIDCYIEYSLSGKGFHIFIRNVKQKEFKGVNIRFKEDRKYWHNLTKEERTELEDDKIQNENLKIKDGIEAYTHKRFMTITGHVYKSSKVIAGDINEIDFLFNEETKKNSSTKNRLYSYVKNIVSIQDVLLKYSNITYISGQSNYYCPLHKDDRPSLAIYPVTNSWNCFGCYNSPKGGDIVSYVQRVFKIPPHQALLKIAGDFNIELDSLDNGHVFIDQGRYFIRTDKEIEVTNFIIHVNNIRINRKENNIEMEDEYDITIDVEGKKYNATVFGDTFTSKNKFISVLNKICFNTLRYTGSEKDLEFIRHYIFSGDIKRTILLDSTGIHKENDKYFYIDCKGTLHNNSKEYYMTKTNASSSDFLTDKRKLAPSELREIIEILLGSFNETLIVPVLGWCTASLYRYRFTQQRVKFPNLSLVGESNSGKNEMLEQFINRFFCVEEVYSAEGITNFALTKMFTESTLIPIILNEFRPRKNKYKGKIISEAIKNCYDNASNIRGNKNMSYDSYKLQSAIITIGEECNIETAIRNRCLEILFDIELINKNSRLRELIKIGDLLENLLFTLILHSSNFTDSEIYEKLNEKEYKKLDGRQENNLKMIHFGITIFSDLLFRNGIENKFPNLESILASSYEDMKENNTKSELLTIFEDFEDMVEMGKLVYGVHYKVVKDIVHLRTNVIFPLYLNYSKQYKHTETSITIKDFLFLIKKKDYFLGNGVVKVLLHTGTSETVSSRTHKFNREKLLNFGFSLLATEKIKKEN